MTVAADTAHVERKPAASVEIDNWTDRLGRLVERYPRFWLTLGNWETRLLKEQIDGVEIDRPVYIAGLARSGSTILLELLAKHPDLATHRYRDFPMVLTPWAWNWFVERAGGKDHVATERAHKDRIKVTPESPEAFEEVLWMAFFPDLHDLSQSAVLDADTNNPEFEAFYRDHIRKLLALRGAARYLAKGNYNVTRIGYLKKQFPDARFIVPVRDPIWHIASLIKQHRLFAAAEAEDQRVLDHMRRSGHFEFGLDRRPINVDGNGSALTIERLWRNGDEAAGWAEHWAAVYGHVAEVLEDPELAEAITVVRYEDLCEDPGGTLGAILEHCDLEDVGLVGAARDSISPPGYYEPSFTEEERAAIRDRTARVAAQFGYR